MHGLGFSDVCTWVGGIMSDIILPEPFGYQIYGRRKVHERHRTAVIGPPGCGKTRIIVEGLNDLGAFSKLTLVLCSSPAVATWLRQIPLWTSSPEYSPFIYQVEGHKGDRMDLWKQAAQTGYGTYITNLNCFYRDYTVIKQIPWVSVVADEYHKTMRSHKVHVKDKTGRPRLKTYGMFVQMTRHVPNLVLATGSLMRRSAVSMFTAFQSVAPKRFSSYWRYAHKYAYVDDSGFGQQVGGVRNAAELRNLMDEFFVYLPPEVVADALPEGLRYGIDVEPTKEQKRIYRDLERDLMHITPDGNVIVSPTILSKIVKQRQLMCCPKILDPSLGMGAGFDAIVDKLDQDPHVAIFVPFRPACDYVKEALEKLGYKHVYILRGGVTPEEQTQIRSEFANHRGIVVCTIDYAESFDLETCKTSYFLGYHLTADQNEQAEGRTRRAISEHEFVTWGYIKTNTPLDLHFLAKLGDDVRNAKLVMGRSDDYIRKITEAK